MKILKTKRKTMMIGALTFMMTTTSIASAQYDYATVIANKGIVRSTADFDGKVIETLNLGTKVSIQDIKGEWFQVQSQDATIKGWMYKDILIANDSKGNILKKGIINATNLNIRSLPSIEANIMSSLPNGSGVAILDQQNEWYQVQLNNGLKGFAHSDYITLVPNYPQGKTLENNSDVMEEPSVEGKLIVTLNKNHDIYIKGYDNGWYNIVTKDFKEGWIDSSIVELQVSVVDSANRSNLRTSSLNNIKSVTDKYLGKPYNYGSAGPNSFDCSGFVYYVLNTHYKDYLKEKGINLPRSSRDQANVGTPVSRNQLQVGDLVFFNNGSSKTINHVGIYIGNNEFVHASSGNTKAVIISSLNANNYNRRYSIAVRL